MSGETCRGCGAPVVFVRMRSGSLMPCDPERVTVYLGAGGPPFVSIVTDEGEVVCGRDDRSAGELFFVSSATGRVSHFATCPHAGKFRRGRR